MPLNAYLKLIGAKQGALEGPVTDPGRKGTILVHSFDHEVITPHDPATGQPTGKREHQPILILKEIDKTSPKLWSAFVNSEALSTWELQLWSPATTPGGADTLVYTISLKNARIVSMHGSGQSAAVTPDAAPSAAEDVSFAYDSVTWTWTDGGVTATDDW